MTFDPATNSFYTTNDPINGSAFASQIQQIDASTGAITIHQIGINQSTLLVEGLGVETNPAVPAPEPATLVLLGIGVTGFGLVRRRRDLP